MSFSDSEKNLATVNKIQRQRISIGDTEHKLANIETFGQPYGDEVGR